MEHTKDKTLFSIIIPTYNHARFINKCLDSVIAQTWSNWEVIVVNNYSEDNTIELVNAYNDKRIRLINFKNNGIIAASRNTGIQEATGEWICFLDSDDFWYHNKLEIVDSAIRNNLNVDAVCHNENMKYETSGKKKLLRHGPYSPNFYRDLLYENRCSTSAMSVRKAFLSQHKLYFNASSDYVIVEDYDLWLKIAFHNGVFYFIDQPLGEYIINEMNLSGNVDRERRNRLKVLHDHIFLIQKFETDKRRLWRNIKAQILLANAITDISLGRWTSGYKNIIGAILASPIISVKYLFSRLIIFLKIGSSTYNAHQTILHAQSPVTDL